MSMHRSFTTACAAAVAAALMLCATSTVTHAEPGEDSPAAQARVRDASIDRGIGSGHAETIGADRWTINSYELFLIGVTYGFTDDFQLSLTTMLPVVEDTPFVLAFAPKYVVTRDDSYVVALRGNIWIGADTGNGGGTVGLVSAGPSVDVYLDERGRFAFHGALTIGGVFGGGFGSGDSVSFAEGALITLDLGFSLGLSSAFKIILEGQMFSGVSNQGFRVAELGLINYGVRFHSDSLAVDLAFIRPVGDVDMGPLILGIPFVSFSARL